MKIDSKSRHVQSAIEAAKSAAKLRVQDPETAVGALRKFAEGIVKDIATNEGIRIQDSNLNSLVTLLDESRLISRRFQDALRRLQMIGNAGLHIGPPLSHRDVSEAWIAYEAILAELPDDVAISIHAQNQTAIDLEQHLKEIKAYYHEQRKSDQEARVSRNQESSSKKPDEDETVKRKKRRGLKLAADNDKQAPRPAPRLKVMLAITAFALILCASLVLVYSNVHVYTPKIGDSALALLESETDVFAKPEANEQVVGEREGAVYGDIVAKDASGAWLAISDVLDTKSYIYVDDDDVFLRTDQSISKFQRTGDRADGLGCYLWKVSNGKRSIIGYRNILDDREETVREYGPSGISEKSITISNFLMNYAGEAVTFEVRAGSGSFIEDHISNVVRGVRVLFVNGKEYDYVRDNTRWENVEIWTSYMMITLRDGRWAQDSVLLQCRLNVELLYELEKIRNPTGRVESD